nr:hypothetical protein [Candidatus Paceibacterota bacterium]
MKRLTHHSLWDFVKVVCLYFVIVVGIFVVLAGQISTVFAQPSYTLNYQGKLTDNTGLTVADGTYDMVFNLYTAPTGGVAVWTETRSGGNVVTVTNGLFSVMLGSVSSLSAVNFNQPLYLGVTIEADAEMTPRKAIGSVPSALEAKQLGGVASSSFLRSDAVDTASGLLTFTGGLISSASSSIARATFVTATTTNLVVNGERFTDLTGTGLTNTNGVLTVATSSLGLSASFSNSAQLAALLSDETGHSFGALAVFSISPVITGTADFVAGDFSSTLTMSGSAANIALGSNYLSGDGGDEGIYVDATGRIGIGTTTPYRNFELHGPTAGTAVIRIDEPRPRYEWRESDAPANEKLWRMEADGSTFSIAAQNDALSQTNAAITITRSGATPTIVYTAGRFGVNDSSPDFRSEIVNADGSGYFGITNSSDGDIF